MARGSSPVDPYDDPYLGKTLDGKYLVDRLLGIGATGAVYRARHVTLARDVAVKVMHQDLLANPASRLRFEQEAVLAGRLRHKNLVGVIDVIELGDNIAMILEFADGRALVETIARGPGDPMAVLTMLRGIASGLAAAHAVGLVHRDLKPENVIVEHDGTPRLIDFGIAISRDSARMTEIGMVLGTPVYMAPEQALGNRVDHRCDLFALGIIAFELFTGRTPFDLAGVDVVLANLSHPTPSFASRAPGLVVDPVHERIVRKLLEKRAEDRYQSAYELLEFLDLAMRDRDAAASLLGIHGGLPLRRATTEMVPVRASSPDFAMPRTRTKRRARTSITPMGSDGSPPLTKPEPGDDD